MNKLFSIFIVTLLFFSCSSDLNFDQVNDLQLKPVVVANLASFDIKANQFLIEGVEKQSVVDIMDFQVFKDVNFTNKIARTDLFFEVNNTFNRACTINLYFLDADNVILYTIPFDVPANTTGITKKEIFENANLDLLKQTRNIGFYITMLPGIPLTESSPGSLKMRSSATIYFVVQ
jgi:hypothetical protein